MAQISSGGFWLPVVMDLNLSTAPKMTPLLVLLPCNFAKPCLDSSSTYST